MFKYSADFYAALIFCLIPSVGFLYAWMNKNYRPWVVRAVEDSDGIVNHIDLTFLATLIFGWLLANISLYGLLLYCVERQDTINGVITSLAGVATMWGLNKIPNKAMENLVKRESQHNG
jgi:hypothetical protein